MKKDSLIYTVVFSFSITFIFVFILSLAASYTEERVKAANRLAIARAYLTASGIDLPEGSDVQMVFRKTFNRNTPGSGPITAEVDGRTIVVSPFSGEGLWGTITGVIAVEGSYDRIVGIEITSHSETPGLGGRIDEEWFKTQFRGESITREIRVVQSGGMGDPDPDNGILDGITGATRTSESIQNIINREIRTLKGEVPFEETLTGSALIKYSYLSAADVTVSSEEEIDHLFGSLFPEGSPTASLIRGRIEGRESLGIPFTTHGLWGEISGVLIFDASELEMVGMDILSHSENMGAAITDFWFKEQFRGLSSSGGIRVIQGETSALDKASGIIDGISGATATNKGIEDGINKVIDMLKGGFLWTRDF